MRDRLRLDVLEIGVRWTVTDARSPAVSYSSLGEAYDAALRRATEHRNAEVHVWRDGQDEKVFETPHVAEPEPVLRSNRTKIDAPKGHRTNGDAPKGPSDT